MRRTIKSGERWSTFTLTPASTLSFPFAEIYPPQNPWSFYARTHTHTQTNHLLFLSINSGVNFRRCDWGSLFLSLSAPSRWELWTLVRVKCVCVPVFLLLCSVPLAGLLGVCDSHESLPLKKKHVSKHQRWLFIDFIVHRTTYFKAVLHTWCETSKLYLTWCSFLCTREIKRELNPPCT